MNESPLGDLAGVGIVLLHRGDPASPAEARSWLHRWHADPYAFDSSFGRGAQHFFAGFTARLDAGTWAQRLAESGGHSPLDAQAETLAAALSEKLSVPVAWGTPYRAPLFADAIAALKAKGARRVVGVSLYPQKCDRFLRPLVRALDVSGTEVSVVDRYPTAAGYVAAVGASVDEVSGGGAAVLFCALPVARGDVQRGDPYAEQLNATVEAVMATRSASWRLSYLAMGAPADSSDVALHRIREAGAESVVLVPLGGAVDELTSGHALDVSLRHTARALGFTRVERARAVGGQPAFVDALAEQVRAHLTRLATLGFA